MIGVRYVSAWTNPSGYGSAARNFITALFTVGINITLETVSQMNEKTEYGVTGAICKQLQNRSIPYKVNIIHLTPDLIPMYKEKNAYNIAHLFWETSKLPKEWVDPLNDVDEVWTASFLQAVMIRASGVKAPIYHFPQPIDVTKAYEEITPYKTGHKKDFTFYSVFQWILRKNPKALLRAYWQEFEGNDNVTLLIKTYRITYLDKEYQLIKEDINQWRKELKLKHYPKVFLVHKLLTDSQMLRFHQMGDVFVNPSSGEGWNRPMQEAMLLGKPTVSGDNGGITDIMTPVYYYKVESNNKQVKQQPFIPWYTSDMTWKELSEEDLRKQMRAVYGMKDRREKEAQEYVIDNFSYQTVGNAMKQRLEAIYKIL